MAAIAIGLNRHVSFDSIVLILPCGFRTLGPPLGAGTMAIAPVVQRRRSMNLIHHGILLAHGRLLLLRAYQTHPAGKME
jgi:hypothetical protein